MPKSNEPIHLSEKEGFSFFHLPSTVTTLVPRAEHNILGLKIYRRQLDIIVIEKTSKHTKECGLGSFTGDEWAGVL